jgi:hypothetical protein
VLESKSQTPEKPEFTFELTGRAAKKNYMVLGKYDFDLSKALEAQRNTPLGYGSEFRDPEILEQLLGKHPNWTRMKKILTEGSTWPLDEINEEEKAKDVREAMKFGNHKGAKEQLGKLRELTGNDVRHGYSLVLPLNKVDKLRGVVVAPMNIAAQNTIDEYGRIIKKDRLTHDQSFTFREGSGTSVNSRVRKDELAPCMFGACMRRVINWICAARRKYPDKRLFMSKVDYKSAFRRCHLSAEQAVQTCTHIPEDDLLLVSLRLTFGGAPCPSEWGIIAETICDLANVIMKDKNWDPDKLYSPSTRLVPTPKPLEDDVPFGEAKELAVDIPVDPKGFCDLFIDDKGGLTVDLPGSDHLRRLRGAILLAIHVVARPRSDDEPIPREWMEAINKLLAEAGAEETKIFLGWLLDLRRLIISLPENKCIAWTTAINVMLEEGFVKAKELESNIGRMVNVGMVLPKIHHFLGRLRTLHQRSLNRRRVKITDACREDLKLMKKFISTAQKGIDLNLLSYRKPNWAHRGDSCPKGLGGYNHFGYAWRWHIPTKLQNRATNNLLEHLANIIGVWIDILAKRLKAGDCVLSTTDSTTSAGWLVKSNFNDDPELSNEDWRDKIQSEVRAEVCRKHAEMMLENNLCEYSQWLEGESNNVADSLSRDDNVPDKELTHLLKITFPEQVPRHLEIVPLPKEIDSWLTCLLQKLPVRTQSQEKHTRTKIGLSYDGRSTQSQLESTTTSSWTASRSLRGANSLEHSHTHCERGDFLEKMLSPWQEAQSQIPFHLWLRPSGITADPTQHWTRTAGLDEFYNSNTEHTKTRIQHRNNKKPSPSAF